MNEQDKALRAAGSSPPARPELTLSHLDSLPTLAPIAVRLLEIASDRESEIRDLVRVLRADQSLTAKLISRANSAGAGVRSPVTTVEKAVVLLGFSAVRSIVLAVKVFECFAAGRPGAEPPSFERVEFWRHSLAVACAARRLAAACPALALDPEEAFVAGLLHDLGKVALDTVFPRAYARIVADGEQTRGDIADSERAILGADHTVAGRRLAERWGLPPRLREVIWLHHLAPETLPRSVACPRLIALINLADTVAREQRVGYSGNYVFYERSEEIARRLGLGSAALAGAVAALVGDVAEQGDALGLNHQTPEDLYFRSLTRANAELARLNAELLASNRRLAIAARYFEAIGRFGRRLSAWMDLPAVVTAIARASLTALQVRQVAAFGLRADNATLDVAWVSSDPDEQECLTQGAPDELRAWLGASADLASLVVTRAPRVVRELLPPAANAEAKDEGWLLPIVHDGQLAGGLVFFAAQDQHARLADETGELRSFLAHLGLALGQGNAQAAARRLSDDLAETNRRLQQTQLQLLRSRTLSMIAEMAAGAGHELNSPLTVISGRAQILRSALSDPDMQRSLELIHNKAHECSRIVNELMDFARPRPPRLAPVDLAGLLAQVRNEWLERSGLPAARFQVHLPWPAGALTVLADREQLKTLLDELVSNAVHAVAASAGTVFIDCTTGATRPSTPPPASCRLEEEQLPGGPAGEWLELTVRDTGVGMTPSVLQRAFDPFFSHRAAGRGRGLGLARAQRIVEAHDGRLWLESRPDEGTTAHLLLPLAERG